MEDYKKYTEFMPPDFWEELGRVIAIFGYLENTLKLTIVNLPLQNITKEELEKKMAKIEGMLTGSLGRLIQELEEILKNLKSHPYDNLIEELKKAHEHRNILVHGSWNNAEEGKAYPFFCRREKEERYSMTLYDTETLLQIGNGIVKLIFACIHLTEYYGNSIRRVQETK